MINNAISQAEHIIKRWENSPIIDVYGNNENVLKAEFIDTMDISAIKKLIDTARDYEVIKGIIEVCGEVRM